MHQIFYQFDFELPDQEESDKLIALLAELGFDGFVEEEDYLTAFVPAVKFDQQSFETVLEKFSVLSYSKTDIENINWNQKWEAEFEPVFVDKFVAVRAHFHAPVKEVEHEIVITPKMSFGTGHHATTYLVMKEMESVDFTGKSVLDFGTGTGILAILAEKLGAARVFAIDNDEWSITNAEENLLQNKCSRIELALMDTIPTGDAYDVILANINLNVITASLPAIASVSHSGTIVLFSGVLHTDEKAIRSAVEQAGFIVQNCTRRGDWLALRTARK